MSEPLLLVENVSVRFGGIVALDRVSFAVARGHIVGLIGPNGAGKTTMFNCLSRLYAFSEGRIAFEGRSLLETPPHGIAALGIGRTFQNLALFRTMSVRQNVLLGGHARSRSGYVANALRLPSVRREEARLGSAVDRLLALLDLGALADVPVMDLPFGTQKRVELGRALASEPKLLLLDEPAGGLNHEEVETLMELLRRIRVRARPDDAAGRAPHEHGDAHLRPGRRARLRQEDRRRHAGRGAGQRRRHPRLSRGRRVNARRSRSSTCAAWRRSTGRRGCCTASTSPSREGGITAILGANGAGKTTLLRAVCDMIRTSGEVRFAGTRIDGQATETIVRLGIAHVPDGRGTFMNLSVEENLRLGALLAPRPGRGRRRFRAHVRATSRA